LGKLEGAKPLQAYLSPSPFKERGIKGVRMIRIIIKGGLRL